jgi:site-specific DNA-methyltransferase (cytosine-N4-specific)
MPVKEVASADVDWLSNYGLLGRTPAYRTLLGAMYLEDSIRILQAIPTNSIDLVMTSPPFALTRQKEYGNEPIDRYIAWLMPFCEEILRILKPAGSFVLDIGGSWEPGSPVRSTYHFEVAVRLARRFKLAQEFYWFNPARLPSPAEWVTVRRVRVKDAVNMVWWFGKTDSPKADNRRVLQPYSESMKTLLKKGYKAQKRPSGHDISKKFAQDNGGAIPPNVFVGSEDPASLPTNFLTFANTESNSHYLRLCRENGIKPHPARYPESLVSFFVDFLTDPGDVVVDPFGGSNVTGAVCEARGRHWISSEHNSDYVEGSKARFVGDEQEGRAPSTLGVKVGQPTLFETEPTPRKRKQTKRRG